MKDVIERNKAAVAEAVAVLRSLEASPASVFQEVGPHFRHCIDFYHCFFQGLPVGRIDYDARQREGTLESAATLAREAFEQIHAQLDRLKRNEVDHPVEIRTDSLGDEDLWSRSTARRELQFVFSHSIHHFALIALLLRQAGVAVPPDFGMAPSTLEHARR